MTLKGCVMLKKTAYRVNQIFQVAARKP
ncbi:hypothetical protein CO2235_170225 [Cupriavidus oxalaticus]|uniref:Uncharacterized protein n=1 Tax=Cupriavidus oxalaticus TaxID=96344 RepID=A0A375G2Y2_9BURK|nr:hypothetical protein CO2235_170225 [Cupriavidus oxalaticus]